MTKKTIKYIVSYWTWDSSMVQGPNDRATAYKHKVSFVSLKEATAYFNKLKARGEDTTLERTTNEVLKQSLK